MSVRVPVIAVTENVARPVVVDLFLLLPLAWRASAAAVGRPRSIRW